jgi:hypothetical protein
LFLLMLVITGLLAVSTQLMTPRTSVNCQQVAAPLVDALERFYKRHGRYPVTLDVLVSEKLLPAIPRIPWTVGVSREGFDYEVDPAGEFYTLFYDEQDWFGGVGPAVARTYRYPSALGAWTTDMVPDEIQAVKLAERKFLSDRSSNSLSSLVSILGKRFKRVRRENISAVLDTGRPCTVDGLVGVCVKADDASAVEYNFVLKERELAGEVVQEVSRIYELDSSGSRPTWHIVGSFDRD